VRNKNYVIAVKTSSLTSYIYMYIIVKALVFECNLCVVYIIDAR